MFNFFFPGGHGAEYIIRIKGLMDVLELKGGIPRLPLLPTNETIRMEAKKLTENYPLSGKRDKK